MIARGFHRRAGLPHAEIEAIRALKKPELARGATLYVTLEPCSTHGRTPPCVEAILRAGFARVVIGAIDPNPAHAGRGVELLRAAGVEVTTGDSGSGMPRAERGFQPLDRDEDAAGHRQGRHVARWPAHAPARRRPVADERRRARRCARGCARRSMPSSSAPGTLRADNPRLTVRGIPGARQPWRDRPRARQRRCRRTRTFSPTNTATARSSIAAKSLRAVLRDLGQTADHQRADRRRRRGARRGVRPAARAARAVLRRAAALRRAGGGRRRARRRLDGGVRRGFAIRATRGSASDLRLTGEVEYPAALSAA